MPSVKIIRNNNEDFFETKYKYVDEENDIYPQPIIKGCILLKVTGFSKIYNAIEYLKVGRVRNLLVNHETEDYNIMEKDGYGLDILSKTISMAKLYDNSEQYELLLFTVLKNIPNNILTQMFNNFCINKTAWNKYLIDEIFGELDEKPHMVLALWNYGLKYTKENVENYKCKIPRKFLIDQMNNNYPSGKKYLSLLNQVCPISLQLIKRPAVLTDGSVYEYEFIREHLLIKNTNPLTNEELSIESDNFIEKINNEWKTVNKKISVKSLYLPENDMFVHFPLK